MADEDVRLSVCTVSCLNARTQAMALLCCTHPRCGHGSYARSVPPKVFTLLCLRWILYRSRSAALNLLYYVCVDGERLMPRPVCLAFGVTPIGSILLDRVVTCRSGGSGTMGGKRSVSGEEFQPTVTPYEALSWINGGVAVCMERAKPKPVKGKKGLVESGSLIRFGVHDVTVPDSQGHFMRSFPPPTKRIEVISNSRWIIHIRDADLYVWKVINSVPQIPEKVIPLPAFKELLHLVFASQNTSECDNMTLVYLNALGPAARLAETRISTFNLPRTFSSGQLSLVQEFIFTSQRTYITRISFLKSGDLLYFENSFVGRTETVMEKIKRVTGTYNYTAEKEIALIHQRTGDRQVLPSNTYEAFPFSSTHFQVYSTSNPLSCSVFSVENTKSPVIVHPACRPLNPYFKNNFMLRNALTGQLLLQLAVSSPSHTIQWMPLITLT
ncbi:hypothetical protein Pelo_8640 [Pelomyxa schiedti]|nr:hypothetical protein Pelo_8640 [Pelomyxa schiedti]